MFTCTTHLNTNTSVTQCVWEAGLSHSNLSYTRIKISVCPLPDQVFCCTANWFLCPLGYLLCDRWLQVAVTLCCHLSPRSLGRKEPAVRSPLRLPVAPRLLWQTPKLLWTRYLPPARGPPSLCSLGGCRTSFLSGWGCESWPLRCDSCTSCDCHVRPLLALQAISSPGFLAMRWAETGSQK